MDIKQGLKHLRYTLLKNHTVLETETWQGQKEIIRPFLEVIHASVKCKMCSDKENAQLLLEPFLPWADIHFEERVSGIPYNPPPSHTLWLKDTDKFYDKTDSQFSHTYPERMSSHNKKGIRYKWGSLQSVVDLLKKDISTRQCYLPIWFPEDITAANLGERVPCTFGWHFMIRDNYMHCSYHMRSCDAIRHLHNDLYLCNLLVLWIIKQIGKQIKPGLMHFSATSLHCFDTDKYQLEKLCAV